MDKYIDGMTGEEFEMFVAGILKQIGFRNIRFTKVSGDQGVDIIAEKEFVRYAIQCKRYSEPVGNKAVQEVISGKIYYDCHVGAVVTNNYFTESAKQLAEKAKIFLWDRDFLNEHICAEYEFPYIEFLKKENQRIKIHSIDDYGNSLLPVVLNTRDTTIKDLNEIHAMYFCGNSKDENKNFINSVMFSALYNCTPEFVKMILIDTTENILPIYNRIPHLMIPIVTNTQKSFAALNWVLSEMENRYIKIEENCVFDLKEYRKKSIYKSMEWIPFIEIIVNDLNDLIKFNKKEVMSIIQKISDYGDRVGVNMVVVREKRLTYTMDRTIEKNTKIERIMDNGFFISENEIYRVVNFFKERY